MIFSTFSFNLAEISCALEHLHFEEWRYHDCFYFQILLSGDIVIFSTFHDIFYFQFLFSLDIDIFYFQFLFSRYRYIFHF